MRKQAVWALLLMAVGVLVLILTKDHVSVTLPGWGELRHLQASIVFFAWMVTGVVIGVLLK